MAALMAIAVGLVCLLGFLTRLGFLSSLLSRPVLIGYLVGIAVLMTVSQLGQVTQLEVEGESTWTQLVSFAHQVGHAHAPTVILALAVLVALYLMKWLTPRIPGALLVLVLAGAVVALFGLDRLGLETIGEVPRGLPS